MGLINLSLTKFHYKIIWVIFILLLLIPNGYAAVEATNQPPPAAMEAPNKPPPAVAATPLKTGQNFNPPMAIVLVCLLIAFLLTSVIFFYFCRCTERQLALAATTRHRGERSSVACGLDPAVIASFSSFTFSAVKEAMTGEQALECAVCLTEFRDDETLRLLPECCHVFHCDCIDQWLALHVTCPVCRTSLIPKPGQLGLTTELGDGPNTPTKGHVSVQVTELKHAHKIGHSVSGRNMERYTLRLLEELQNSQSVESGMERSVSVNFIRGSDYFSYERFDEESQSNGRRLRVPKSFISRGRDDSAVGSIASSLNHLFRTSNKDSEIVKRLNDT